MIDMKVLYFFYIFIAVDNLQKIAFVIRILAFNILSSYHNSYMQDCSKHPIHKMGTEIQRTPVSYDRHSIAYKPTGVGLCYVLIVNPPISIIMF